MSKTILLAVLAATFSIRAASAQLTLIPSAQAFGTPGGTIVWTDLSSPIPNPSTFNVTGISGLTARASSLQLCPCRSPIVFGAGTQGPNGVFHPGDPTLTVFGFAKPLSLSFSTPVFSFGTQIGVQPVGDWLAVISAYNASDEALGTFYVPWFEDELKVDDSAPFVGVAYSGGISRIELSVDGPSGFPVFTDYSINQGLVSRVVATPEPSPFSLVAIGLICAYAMSRHRTRRSSMVGLVPRA